LIIIDEPLKKIKVLPPGFLLVFRIGRLIVLGVFCLIEAVAVNLLRGVLIIVVGVQRCVRHSILAIGAEPFEGVPPI
jgi:hypothetical protein